MYDQDHWILQNCFFVFFVYFQIPELYNNLKIFLFKFQLLTAADATIIIIIGP